MALILDERGFLATEVLAIYLVIIITLLAFIFSLGLGMKKEATAKYMWFSEALEFATHAANQTGDIQEITSNKTDAKQYFINAMNEFEMNYRLISFDVIDTGDRIQRGATAQAPGYMATIEVPIFQGNVPLIGEQRINVQMRYFAVAKSQEIN